MPSYIPELFNTDPYYDDFNEQKKFLRIMFRPGYGVQARELTQVQTILQNQIERFGDHVFEEGSIVSGGKINVNSLKYARVMGLSGTTDVKDFIGVVARGATTARARIVHAEYGLTTSSVDNFAVVFFDYLDGGTGFVYGSRIEGTAANDTLIAFSVTGTSVVNSSPPPVGNALVVSVDEGVRFAEGFFVYHEAQKIGAYGLSGPGGSQVRWFDSPNTRIGFSVDKSFVDADTDTTLKDPAYGSYNYNAPGADRFQIDLNIAQSGYTATNTSAVDNFSRTDFIEFIRLVDGSPIKIEKYPEYAVLEESLARRTFDESGNYTVRPFEVNLVNGVGITNSGETGSIFADLEPGKAYVFGYEFETQSNTRLELEAARTSTHERTLTTVDFNRGVGPYCQVEFSGITASIHSFTGFDQQQLVYLSSGLSASTQQRIGTARVRGIEWDTGNIFNLYLYNVEMTGPSSFNDTTRIFTEPSGASHAFSITGTVGLQNTKDGDLLYIVPSGSRVKTITSADYAVAGHFKFFNTTPTSSQFTSSGGIVSANFDLYAQTYTVNAGSRFSISPSVITTINSDDNLMAFDRNGAVGGTAIRTADGTINVTLRGKGVTHSNTIFITTSIDINDISTFKRSKSSVTESLSGNAGGFTGFFSGLTSDQYGNSVLYFGGKTDVYEVISLTGVYDTTTTQVKNYFTFDSGQRDNIYDWSRMVLNAGITAVTGPYWATIKRFNHSGVGPFTVDSYSGVNYSDIPDYTSRTTGKTYNLADVIDFRPDRGPSGSTGTTGVPWIPTNTVANDNEFSYTHYLPRTDKIVLKRDRTFSVIQGVPSLDAITPPDDPNAMTLYNITLNPYTYDKDDTSLRYVDNRRYTMRDIGELEKRIEAVEYYTTLSLLEQEAKTLSIVDSDGIEMPKKGILVDQFKGHNIGDVTNLMYAASIDFEKNELRPPFEHRVFGFTGPYGSRTNTLTVSEDGIITLPYTLRSEINQVLATDTEFVNSSSIVNYLGNLKLTPSGDYWFSNALNPVVRVNVDGENNAWASGQGLGFSGGGFGSQWNDWESNWYGRDIPSETTTKPNLPVQNSVVAKNKGVSLGNTYKSGVPEGIKRKSVTKTIKKDIIPYARKQNVTLEASGLKPNTTFYVFLDNIDITAYCTGSSQKTDSKGYCTVQYRGATGDTVNNFLTGRRNFRITDSSTNTVSQSTMAADATYNSIGAVDTLNEDGILSTRPTHTRRRSVKSNKIQSNLSELLSTDFFGFTEPMSQTFFVDPVKYPNGVFIKNVGIAFATKSTDNNIPITAQIRPTVSGYPHPSKIIPFGEKTLYSDNITTSSDGSTETTFTFSSPIYLLPGNEYAICLVTNSSEFTVYKAVVGSNIINLTTGVADRKATKQPGIRSLFTPQNTGSLKKNDNESLRFSLGVCIFSPQSGECTYRNDAGSYAGSTFFDVGRINVNHILPSSTNIIFEEDGLLNTSATLVQANKNFDRPAIAAASREKTASTNFTNLKMKLYGNAYVSPVVDSESSHFLIVKNNINNNTDLNLNYELNPTNLGATADNRSAARYITKQVILEEGFEATDIYVQMALSNPPDSTIQVFVRPMPIGESDFTNISYQQLSPTTAASIGYSSNPDTFREITFSKQSLSKFRAFSIKIVMYSSNATTTGKDPRSIPKIKNLRIIAV